jgi:hypothetical protein
MATRRPWATWERTNVACSASAAGTSAVNWVAPASSGPSSVRRTRCPRIDPGPGSPAGLGAGVSGTPSAGCCQSERKLWQEVLDPQLELSR